MKIYYIKVNFLESTRGKITFNEGRDDLKWYSSFQKGLRSIGDSRARCLAIPWGRGVLTIFRS